MSAQVQNPVLDSVQYWLAYIDCALKHPPLPEGEHNFNPNLQLVPEVMEVYPVVFELYTNVKESAPFREPVNALDTGVFHYYEAITSPMSIRDVLEKIAHGHYSNAQQVASDVELIWANCEQFNGAESMLSKQARECDAIFKTALQNRHDNAEVPTELISKMKTYIEDHGDEELMNQVYGIIESDAPQLLSEGEVDLSGLRRGVFKKIQALLERHAMKKV